MSQIQRVNLPSSFKKAFGSCYELSIYRGDLEHSDAPGNKWHKLRHHLLEAKRLNADVIGTFGGPFSNHLHAFAQSLTSTPFLGVAVVRGELQPRLTPTLNDVVSNEVRLWPSSRLDYRLGMSSLVVQQINDFYRKRNLSVYWIPEGGGGELGALGCQDWAEDIYALDSEFDAWVVSAGTGTTAAGLLSYSHTPFLNVFSALKGSDQQQEDILNLADQLNSEITRDQFIQKFHFHSDCHEGGYAKHSPELIDFIEQFSGNNPDIMLDPIYTCKSMYALFKKMESSDWPHRRTLFIHTGGIQGWRGYSSTINPFT